MEILNYHYSYCLKVCVLLLTFMINTAYTDNLPSILWASYGTIFKNLKGSPRTVFIKDHINFICPNNVIYVNKSNTDLDKDMLYANIYMVDKEGYDNCNATGGKKIKVCDDPLKVKHAKVTIFTIDNLPNSQLPFFKAGHLHYFIDTSDGSQKNVSNLIGGKCRTENMKMKMYVCKDKSDKACPYGNDVINGGWSSWGQCSQSGTQTRQCNNPTPYNGGFGCQGVDKRPCLPSTTAATTTTTITQPNHTNNDTITPKKEKRTGGVADTLGTLSVGEAVAIFLAVFVFGVLFGVLLGFLLARTTFAHRHLNNVLRRKTSNSADQFNRNSIVSTTKMRPFSTVSNDTTLTGVTGFTSYNDIYDASTS